MIKKVLISTAALALVGTFVFGRDAFTYVKTSAHSVRDAIRSQVPLDEEIKVARDLVNNLLPEIDQCKREIAEAEVDVDYRAREVARQEEALSKQKEQILARKLDVESGNVRYVVNGQTYSQAQLEQDLARRFKHFKLAEQRLNAERKLLNTRRQVVDNAKEKLENMMTAKSELQVKIENLDARLQALQAAEAASNVNIDDSRLSRAKELITELNKKLDVRSKLLDTEEQMLPLIPVQTGPVVPENLTEQIDQYFDNDQHSEPAGNSDA